MKLSLVDDFFRCLIWYDLDLTSYSQFRQYGNVQLKWLFQSRRTIKHRQMKESDHETAQTCSGDGQLIISQWINAEKEDKNLNMIYYKFAQCAN